METLRQEMSGLARTLFEDMKGWQTAYDQLTGAYLEKGARHEDILGALEAAGYATSTPVALALSMREHYTEGKITSTLKALKNSNLSPGFIAETLGVLYAEKPLLWLLQVLRGSGFSLHDSRDAATSFSPLIGVIDPKSTSVSFDRQHLAYVGFNLKKAQYLVDLSKPSKEKGFFPELTVRRELQSTDSPLLSPDIIPRLQKQKSFRHNLGVADDSLWNTRFTEEQPHAGKTSQVYVRFSNTGNVPLTPACALYYATAATVSHPNVWTHIGTQSASFRMSPGAREVLEFEVPALNEGHYCFIAVVDSGLFPAIIPDPMEDGVDLVKKHPNIGWHNFDVVQTAANTAQALPEFRLGNTHAQQDNFKLIVRHKNLPAGTWKLAGSIDGTPINDVTLDMNGPTEIHQVTVAPKGQPKVNLTLHVPAGIVIPNERPLLSFIQTRNGAEYGGISFHLAPKA